VKAVEIVTPPLPLLVPPETFDAFGWCPSTTLEWRRPSEALTLNPLDDRLPLRMAFVFRAPWSALPAERAWLHTGRDQALAVGLGDDDLALAPYALDDATDGLWEHRRPPREVFWLAADNTNALYWALHDWSHFHNHGSFEDRPATELQCDVAALVWLWLNREAAGLPDAHWDALRVAALANHHALRAVEPHTRAPPPDLLADGRRLRSLARALARR